MAMAAATTATSSGLTSVLAPNAPPMSCAVTRGKVAGSFARRPTNDRVMCTRRLGSRTNGSTIAVRDVGCGTISGGGGGAGFDAACALVSRP